ncbi:hypothetical protein EVAR_70523_1 [Eumeta japonica]|uniref:MADF domain-containing protein n=1 Tax=Eumeta variegata TaxID=151549 RepID=A0A4C2A943_EUMVA|nr:hypothetical protein EVAR_70523_1 [Eumeta japonica]
MGKKTSSRRARSLLASRSRLAAAPTCARGATLPPAPPSPAAQSVSIYQAIRTLDFFPSVFAESEYKKTCANLRENYRRAVVKKRTKSGQAATSSKNWQFEEEMSFLLPHMKQRKTISSLTEDDSEVDENFDFNELLSNHDDSPMSSNDPAHNTQLIITNRPESSSTNTSSNSPIFPNIPKRKRFKGTQERPSGCNTHNTGPSSYNTHNIESSDYNIHNAVPSGYSTQNAGSSDNNLHSAGPSDFNTRNAELSENNPPVLEEPILNSELPNATKKNDS